jgi:hypothetical protein
MSMNCVLDICCDSPCLQPDHTCDLPGREGHCVPITNAPAPALTDLGKVIGLGVLLLIAGTALRRRRLRQ